MQAVMVLSISLLSILIIASIIEAREGLPDVGNNDQGDQGNLRKPANEDQQREQQQRQQQSAAVPARGGVGEYFLLINYLRYFFRSECWISASG